jgi:hypothetical protein
MTRDTLLSRAPLEIGALWAEVSQLEILRQGRPVEGGWPGTLSEARARILAYLDRELTLRKMPLLNIEELLAATHATYAQARRDWLSAQVGEKQRRRRRRAGQ